MFAGHSAPDFSVSTLDGKQLKLSDLKGKLVLMDFWATWCAPCLAELKTLKQAHEKFSRQGLIIVSFSFDQNADTAREFAKKQEMTWLQVWLEGAEKSDLARLYGVSAIPATFLIGPDGVVLWRDLRGKDLLREIRRQIRQSGSEETGP